MQIKRMQFLSPQELLFDHKIKKRRKEESLKFKVTKYQFKISPIQKPSIYIVFANLFYNKDFRAP